MAFSRLIRCLPEAKMIFAYGSGMFPQLNHAKTHKNMLDLVIVTDNTHEWHKQNITRNSHHYSFLKEFGAKAVAAVQENFGAQIYYNTLVEIDGRQVKYGVISEKSLVDDLLNWRTLYVSGRLHKPVHFLIKDVKYKALEEALVKNIHNALHTALLLLPPKFSEASLFKTLASLSYTGDFRMQIGEDQNKVENIVAPNLDRFRELYDGPIERFSPHLHWHKSQGTLEQSNDPFSILHHLNSLPITLQTAINNPERAEHLLDLARNPSKCQETVSLELSKIVKESSWSQSLKGIFTAGISKSFYYSKRKIEKYYKSLNHQH